MRYFFVKILTMERLRYNYIIAPQFYDNSILPGTKIHALHELICNWFYDNSILPGTKINVSLYILLSWFYDNSILPGTKMQSL